MNNIIEQISLKFRVDDKKNFDSFFSVRNEMVIEELNKFLTGSGSWLYLCGNKKSGITHLIQAVYNQALILNFNVSYISIIEIISSFNALSEKKIINYFDGIESCDFVCIDDVEKVIDDIFLEEQFFYLLERLKNRCNSNILMGGHISPINLECNFKDLQSRLMWATGFNLTQLPDQEKINFLKFKSSRVGLDLSDDAASYILKRCDRSVGELSKIVDILDSFSLKKRRAITIPLIKEALSL